MEEGKNRRKGSNLPGSFAAGAIALVFLIIGYQVALFVHHAAALKIAANRDHPDTVYVIDEALARRVLGAEIPGTSPVTSSNGKHIVKKMQNRSEYAKQMASKAAPRPVESFRFNPNTVSLEDLMRLGFSEKQAQSIDNYRQKGGRFRRPQDFAKSYVVADSVYTRLEPFIDIPKLDINKADSLALLDLPGIGPWFAGKIVSYRTALGGFSSPQQLMEIYHFDKDKYDGLKDLITCSHPDPYPLWTLPEEELAKHPYISKAEAHGIVLYRKHNTDLSVEGLKKAGVLSEEHAGKLSGLRLPVHAR